MLEMSPFPRTSLSLVIYIKIYIYIFRNIYSYIYIYHSTQIKHDIENPF